MMEFMEYFLATTNFIFDKTSSMLREMFGVDMDTIVSHLVFN